MTEPNRIGRKVALAAAAVVAVLGALAAPALSEAYDATFNGGGLFGLSVDEGFTQASFQDLSYSYEYCGDDPLELTCEWEIKAVLHADPATRCSPSTPESSLVWDSGPQPGNGSVSSGPQSFALEGCPGQALAVSYEAHSTFEPGEGGWHVISSGGGATLTVFTFGAHWLEEAEGVVRIANPATAFPPPPAPVPFSVSSDCRGLTIGSTRYAFHFRQMGCRKATDIATAVHLFGGSPTGYRCLSRSPGGTRCQRLGHPRKYVEWSLPVRSGRR